MPLASDAAVLAGDERLLCCVPPQPGFAAQRVQMENFLSFLLPPRSFFRDVKGMKVWK